MAMGEAHYVTGAHCYMGLKSLGTIQTGSVYRLVWGNQTNTPTIICQSQGDNAFVRWSWSYGNSSLTCNQTSSTYGNDQVISMPSITEVDGLSMFPANVTQSQTAPLLFNVTPAVNVVFNLLE